jgi:excisionase family DNA binding protein
MIYLIRERTTNHFKIGFTQKSEAKVRQYELQTSNANHLDLIGTIEGGKEKEKELHSKFAQYRVINAGQEWFDLPDNYVGNLIDIFTPKQIPDHPKFEKCLRAEEVAQILSISRTQAYRLISIGELPSLKFAAKTVRVRESDLRDFIKFGPDRK